MKIKKLLVGLLAVIMTVGVCFAFTACSNDGDKDKDKDTGTNTKSYQLEGEFRDDLAALGNGFDFLVDLKADNTAVVARYNPFSYDASDAATNKSYEAEFMKGTWKAAKKDGVDCLQIKLACYDKGAEVEGSAFTGYAYEVAGTYSVEISFPLVKGMAFKRQVTVSGGETKKYADANAFIKAKKMTFTAPEHVTVFEAKGQDNNVAATLYVQNGGKVLMYSGYSKIAEGTYTKNDTAMTITINDTPIEVTVEGTKGSFSYVHDMGYGDYKITYNFACADLTKVPAVEAPAAPKYTSTNTVTVKNPMNQSDMQAHLVVELTDDTNCKYYVSEFGGQLGSFDCTYTLNNGVITLTLKGAEPTEGMNVGFWTIMKTTLTWTLDDTNHTMTVKTA